MNSERPDPHNARTVYVAQADYNKDLSDARRFGNLRAVFTNPRRPYDIEKMIIKAQHVLADWQPGDYLLMLGDPTLCAVCMTVVAEDNDVVNVLSWDRNTFQYQSQRWDFTPRTETFEPLDHIDQDNWERENLK
jgi:hypothetical protein